MDSITREWTGFQNFPAATQRKLSELLQKLREKGVNYVTILVMGKGGTGKSSTINSLIGERVVYTNSFKAEATRPVMISRIRGGLTLNIIDTPGLVEGGYVSCHSLELVKRFLLNKTIDVLLYVDRLDAYRVDDLDKQIVAAISNSFGKQIWCKSLLVLTHAQFCPPDDLQFDIFSMKRSQAVMKTIHMGAGFRKHELEGLNIPVCLVENSGRCDKNEDDEKILLNGTTWISSLVKEIICVATNGVEAVVFDKKLVDGSEVSKKGKLFIPLAAIIQWLIVKWIQGEIKNDVARAGRPL